MGFVAIRDNNNTSKVRQTETTTKQVVENPKKPESRGLRERGGEDCIGGEEEV